MAGPDEEAEKTHEPTPHKLEEARKKGEVPRSADLNTAAAYGGFLLTGLAAGVTSISQVSSALMVLLDQSVDLATQFFEGASAPVGGLIGTIALGLMAWFLIPAGAALLSVLAQRSFVVAPTKLKPKMSRLSLVQNAKNKYGLSGLFEFLKSFAKLVLYTTLLCSFLSFRLNEMAGSLHSGPLAASALMMRLLIEFMFVVLLISLAIGAVDYLWHYHDHMRKNRMSHREIREEHKQHEGEPHMKQERRHRASQIAASQMMADVPKADVVIVNPIHYAVALKWSRLPGAAPECVAKGTDHMAMAIRKLAMENGIPIHHDAPTARALHATTSIGHEIDPEHYRAVAAAIRFAERMRRKMKAFG